MPDYFLCGRCHNAVLARLDNPHQEVCRRCQMDLEVEILERTIEFTVPGPPVSWHVYTRWDKSLSKQKFKAFQEHVRLCAALAMGGREPHRGPVELAVDVYRPIPASAPKGPVKRAGWCREHLVKPPDADNYAKGIQDALEGATGVYLSDAQVIKRRISKNYMEGEGETLIAVRLLE